MENQNVSETPFFSVIFATINQIIKRMSTDTYEMYMRALRQDSTTVRCAILIQSTSHVLTDT